jgi:predicted alpha/beta superfamily hydrolase
VLKSAVLGEDRRILVVLPRRYDADPAARYPVLYKLDGDNQLDGYGQSIDVLSGIDAIPDLIVVAIPNGRGLRNRDLTPSSLHQDGNEAGQMGTGEMGQGDRFLDFLERDLIPYVERNYRTTRERILAGHSRGALLAMQSLLIKPGLFEARFLFSAPLMRDEQRLVADAPPGLRWTIERARGANHQQTQPMALPPALSDYFAGRQIGAPNRLGRVSSGPSRD